MPKARNSKTKRFITFEVEEDATIHLWYRDGPEVIDRFMCRTEHDVRHAVRVWLDRFGRAEVAWNGAV